MLPNTRKITLRLKPDVENARVTSDGVELELESKEVPPELMELVEKGIDYLHLPRADARELTAKVYDFVDGELLVKALRDRLE